MLGYIPYAFTVGYHTYNCGGLWGRSVVLQIKTESYNVLEHLDLVHQRDLPIPRSLCCIELLLLRI